MKSGKYRQFRARVLTSTNKTSSKLIALLLTFNVLTTHSVALSEPIRVNSIIDGDTIKLSTGQSVRLLQIDTPEMRGAECYAQEARRALAKLLSGRGVLKLVKDPKLDQTDSYGRLLRYIFVGNTNINLKMVQIGAASPYFYKNQRGLYSKILLRAAENARAKNLGLWLTCPGTKLNPYSALSTVHDKSSETATTEGASSYCDPNYSGCVPPFPPDLDCSDIEALGIAPIKVIGKDVHRLDRDGDSLGCD